MTSTQCGLFPHKVFISVKASSSNTSVSQQPKGSSVTDIGIDVASGSDTEAATTSTEKTVTGPIHQARENIMLEKPPEEGKRTAEQALKSLASDSPTVSVQKNTEDETSMKIEVVQKVADAIVMTSKETAALETVTRDCSTAVPHLKDCEKGKIEKQAAKADDSPTQSQETGTLHATQDAPLNVAIVLSDGVQPGSDGNRAMDSAAIASGLTANKEIGP